MFILHCDVRVPTHNFPSQAATYFVRAWCGEGGHGYKCTSSKRRMASSPLLTLSESRATRQRFNIVLDHDSAAGLRHVPCSYSACLGQSRAPVSNPERAQPGFETKFLAVYVTGIGNDDVMLFTL